VVLQGFEIEETDGEKYLTVPAVIFDDAAIDAISTGDAVEISPGYTCFLESNDGNYYQKQRRYDHVALVSRGRTGSDVSVKLDEQMKEETTTETDTVSVLNPNPTELRRFLIDNAECFQGLPDSTLDRIDTLEQACDLWLSNNLPEALKAVKVDAAGFVSVIKHYQLELTTQQQKTDSIVAELTTKLEKKSEEKTDAESTKSELSDIEIEQKTDSDIIAIARQKYKARTFGITV
jgi:hypothetical protein